MPIARERHAVLRILRPERHRRGSERPPPRRTRNQSCTNSPPSCASFAPTSNTSETFAEQATPTFTDLGVAAPGINRTFKSIGPFASEHDAVLQKPRRLLGKDRQSARRHPAAAHTARVAGQRDQAVRKELLRTLLQPALDRRHRAPARLHLHGRRQRQRLRLARPLRPRGRGRRRPAAATKSRSSPNAARTLSPAPVRARRKARAQAASAKASDTTLAMARVEAMLKGATLSQAMAEYPGSEAAARPARRRQRSEPPVRRRAAGRRSERRHHLLHAAERRLRSRRTAAQLPARQLIDDPDHATATVCRPVRGRCWAACTAGRARRSARPGAARPEWRSRTGRNAEWIPFIGRSLDIGSQHHDDHDRAGARSAGGRSRSGGRIAAETESAPAKMGAHPPRRPAPRKRPPRPQHPKCRARAPRRRARQAWREGIPNMSSGHTHRQTGTSGAAGKSKSAAGHTSAGKLANAPAPPPSTLTPPLPGGARRGDRGDPRLLHRKLPRPPVPAADLPGGRHRVRHPLAGAGGDQRGRDRLRSRPQRLKRRSGGLDAVPALLMGALRGGRHRLGLRGSLQPGRRDLRRGALPCGRRRGAAHSRGRVLLQPLRRVRRSGDAARTAARRHTPGTAERDHRPHRIALPRARRSALQRRLPCRAWRIWIPPPRRLRGP